MAGGVLCGLRLIAQPDRLTDAVKAHTHSKTRLRNDGHNQGVQLQSGRIATQVLTEFTAVV